MRFICALLYRIVEEQLQRGPWEESKMPGLSILVLPGNKEALLGTHTFQYQNLKAKVTGEFIATHDPRLLFCKLGDLRLRCKA
jgi:hypothetical protein